LYAFRKYEDRHGLYFPRSSRTLIIVEKEGSELTFPFDMFLSTKMFVDIRGESWARRFVGRKKPDQGWTFHFAGNYNRREAQKAVQEMREAEESNGFVPKICGLRAAAVQYLQNVQDGSYGALPSPASQLQPQPTQ
jgi:hypothetical protein